MNSILTVSAIPLIHMAIWCANDNDFPIHSEESISSSTILILNGIVLAVMLVGIIVMLKRTLKIVPPGMAIIRVGMGGTQVSFSKILCFPHIHQSTLVDITSKVVEIEREGAIALICKDHLRVDVRCKFYVRINATAHDVLKVAQSLGSERISNHEKVTDFLEPRFAEGLKTVAYRSTLKEIVADRERFLNEVLKQIGDNLNGYTLENLTFDYLEQTPVTKLDPDNILDAEGIRKIYTQLDATLTRKIHDITYPISEQLTVWPNDTAVSITHTREVGHGSRATVSRLVLSSHAGTHMDAPSHFLEDGGHIDGLDLSALIGPCEVVETNANTVSYEVLEKLDIPKGTTRLLIKTKNGARFSRSEPFFSDYVGVNISGAKWLLEHKIKLVGIDYMSIADYADIKEVHHALLSVEMILLETLDLRQVTPGPYRLIALPLRLEKTDGSPVRAVLLPMN